MSHNCNILIFLFKLLYIIILPLQISLKNLLHILAKNNPQMTEAQRQNFYYVLKSLFYKLLFIKTSNNN